MSYRRRARLDTVLSHLEKALDGSPTDYTELIWIETRGQKVASSSRAIAHPPQAQTTVLVRVRELRRFGHHRTGSDEAQLLQDAIRNASAQARCHAPVESWRAPRDEPLPDLDQESLFDPRLSDMSPEEGRTLLQEALDKGERGQLEWTEGRIVIANSRGLRRKAQVTAATAFVSTGRGSQAGTARSSARSLQRLDLGSIVRRARDRRCTVDSETHGEAIEGNPAVLSSEAVTSLLEELSSRFLTPPPECQEGYFQRWGGHRIGPLTLDLLDDGGASAGMAFPFDLKGAAKRPLWLIRGGILQPCPRGRAAPDDQLGPFSAGGGEVQCSNLLVEPGKTSEDELLVAAHQGVWIGSLSHIEWTEPREMRLRCRARGLRRIRTGRLAEALPDQILETSLENLLRQVLERGDTTTSRALGSGVFGGTTAPALLLGSWPSRSQADR